MKYVFISRIGDKEQFLSFHKSLKILKNEELINQYNREARMGIVGVHAQALKLLAMRKVFIGRFGKSPVQIDDEIVISLEDIIDLNYLSQQ